MTILTPRAHEALDRLDEIGACWQALSDLMTPDGDLQSPQRDHLSTLLDFLQREYVAASERLRHALHSPAPETGRTPAPIETRAHAGQQDQ